MADKMISVIVPFYNREKTAARCLNSLLASTCGDIEIIAVDDGSTDGTADILKSFAAADCRIKLVSQTNGGPSAARNRGLDEATGEFIAFCDSDDYVDPAMYEKMRNEQQAANADIVLCGYYRAYENGENIAEHLFAAGLYQGKAIANNIIRQYYGGNTTGLAMACNKLYRKDFLRNHHLRFDETLHRGEDWWFNLHAYECAGGVSVMDEPLYYYCQDSGGSQMKMMKLEYYFQWKASNGYLLAKNRDIYHFEVDYDRFYEERLFTIHALLLSLTAQKLPLDPVLDDEYYNAIIKYDKLTSAPVKFLHKLHKLSKMAEKAAYQLLAAYYRRKK